MNQFISEVKQLISWPMILVLLSSLFFSGCQQQEEEDKRIVTVSIAPQKYFAKQLLPENYEVNVMVPPGSSPATYEPTTRQLQKLQKSGAYIRIGEIEFEKVWMEKIKSINPTLPVFDASAGVTFIEDGNHNHNHGSGHHHERDPHIWTSPKLCKTVLLNTAEALIKSFPADSAIVQKKYYRATNVIDSLDREIEAMLAPHAGKHFLIYHPALSYFARDYNLNQLAIESLGKEPSASGMASILKIARQEGIATVFIQQQFNQRSAKTIAEELDAKVVTINPLDENWDSAMGDIASKIKAAF